MHHLIWPLAAGSLWRRSDSRSARSLRSRDGRAPRSALAFAGDFAAGKFKLPAMDGKDARTQGDRTKPVTYADVMVTMGERRT